MNLVMKLVDFILHIDIHLDYIISTYGGWTYGFLFFIIFMETGFVITPFLPGDSLIFAAATFAARGAFNPWLLFLLLAFAAIAGDNLNYWVGHAVGYKAYTGEVKWIKKEYMERTFAFYKKHGGKTIFLARFVPIIRTFSPFVAGVSNMPYGYFLTWDVIGGVTWVATFTLLGYFFGNFRFVHDHFELAIIAIILISLIPAVTEVLKARREGKKHNLPENN